MTDSSAGTATNTMAASNPLASAGATIGFAADSGPLAPDTE